MKSAVEKAIAGGESLLTNTNSLTFDYATMAEAFPECDPGLKPLGNLGVFQIRRPKKTSAGGIQLDAGTRSTEYYNTQVAKCISVGPLAFKTVRNVDGEEKIFDWPEGPWFKPGDYVRVPRYGGDRYAVKATFKETENMIGGGKADVTTTEELIFAVFKVKDIQGVITGDPRVIKAYLD